MADQRRALRLGQEIKDILIGIVDSVRDPRVGLATVTDVVLMPDLRLAKVYVSVAGSEKEKSDSLRALEHARNYIRHEMASELVVRRVPDLQFYLDNTLEESTRIERLLEEIHKKDESD